MKPKGIRQCVALGAGLCVLLAWTLARGAEAKQESKPAGQRVKVWGDVATQKDKDNKKITAVTLTSVHGVKYAITLDEAGMKLGQQMDGKRAAVIGWSSGEGMERSFIVESFSDPKQDAKKKQSPAKKGPAKKTTPQRKPAKPRR